jgi:hypothetical protein
MMPVNPIQKRGEIDEQVARIDKLEVEEFLLARHGWSLVGDSEIPIPKNGEIDHGLLAAMGSCVLPVCLQPTCMI